MFRDVFRCRRCLMPASGYYDLRRKRRTPTHSAGGLGRGPRVRRDCTVRRLDRSGLPYIKPLAVPVSYGHRDELGPQFSPSRLKTSPATPLTLHFLVTLSDKTFAFAILAFQFRFACVLLHVLSNQSATNGNEPPCQRRPVTQVSFCYSGCSNEADPCRHGVAQRISSRTHGSQWRLLGRGKADV